MNPYFRPPTPTNIVYAMYDYYSEGHSLSETSRKFGIGKTGVVKGFRRHNLTIRSSRHGKILEHRQRTQTELNAMLADFRNGLSADEIARKYHYSRSGIYSRFKRAGYPIRKLKGE